MMTRAIQTIMYATPDLIPADLRPVAVLMQTPAVAPAHVERVVLNHPSAKSLAVKDQVLYGGVFYASIDLVPPALDVVVAENDLFWELFGAALDGAVWQTVDTESKISVGSGLLSFSGGMAVPAYGDPMIERIVPFTRTVGLTFEAKVRAATTNASGPWFILSTALPLTLQSLAENEQAIAMRSVGITAKRQNGTAYVGSAYAAGTWYWWRIQLLATGQYLSLSRDGVTWYRFWNEPTGATATLYPVLMTYDQAGDVDYLRVYQSAVPAALVSVTPGASAPATTGGDIIQNGGFADGTNWTLDADWSIGGGVATKVANVATANATNTPSSAVVVGNWYQVTATFVITAGTMGVQVGGVTLGTQSSTGDLSACGRASFTTAPVVYGNAAAAGTVDNVTCTQVTLVSLHGSAIASGVRAGLFEKALTCTVGNRSGFYLCCTDETNPTYELQVTISRTDGVVRLVKRENNVETVLISTATGVTYADTRKLRVVIVPVAGSANSSVAVYYESAANVFTQIGTTQTVDLSLYGTRVGRFSTLATDTTGLLEVHA